MTSHISKIAIMTVLLGLLVSLLGFIFSTGYERQKGLLGNLASMTVVLSQRRMLPYFEKVEQGKENTNAETVQVENDDKSKAVYEFPKGSSLDTMREAMNARENKRGKKRSSRVGFVLCNGIQTKMRFRSSTGLSWASVFSWCLPV